MTEKKRQTARRSRAAAVGIGVATMAGLVGSMQVADGGAAANGQTPSSTDQTHRAAATADRVAARARAAAVPEPIVLTPRTVVRSVSAPAAGGSGSTGTSASPAPAAPSTPVATTSGSG